MAGFSTLIATAAICSQAEFVVSMNQGPGSVESIPTTSVNMTHLLKRPANFGLLRTTSLKNIVATDLRNGNKGLKSTTKFYTAQVFIKFAYFIGIFAAPIVLFAQVSTLEKRIEIVSSALAELDDKAKICLNTVEKTDTRSLINCDDFLKAVDGELLARYIADCDALKLWRDDFVSDQSLPPSAVEKNLRAMMEIEFACGENALQKRTQYVTKAVELLQNNFQQSQAYTSINRRISEIQLNQLLSKERSSLESSVFEQNQRVRSETNQQQNELEKELLRQEIMSPPFPGN